MSIDFERIWQSLPNPAVLTDRDGRIEGLNGAAEDFLAMSVRALKGKDLTALAGGESRLSD
ncbi:MAG: PAS domain-containing protein, partial [Pseudomonadota bacterium]